jgi:two-component system KDP operon response regulator KdpE
VPTALLLEDEPRIRRVVKAALEAEGWTVHEAGGVAEALTAARRHRPDLVVADLGLPDGDGVDFVRALRGWSGAPVIVLSARFEEAQKIAALDAGADDFVVKPFAIGEFTARVRAHLRRGLGGRGDAPNPVVLGDVEVDLAQRQVRRAGAEVHLTPIEYRLLEVFLANAGRVLTHRQLLREVWGPARPDLAHHLRVHMANLRRKLEADPAQPAHFVTEVGVGYRLLP